MKLYKKKKSVLKRRPARPKRFHSNLQHAVQDGSNTKLFLPAHFRGHGIELACSSLTGSLNVITLAWGIGDVSLKAVFSESANHTAGEEPQ